VEDVGQLVGSNPDKLGLEIVLETLEAQRLGCWQVEMKAVIVEGKVELVVFSLQSNLRQVRLIQQGKPV